MVSEASALRIPSPGAFDPISWSTNTYSSIDLSRESVNSCGSRLNPRSNPGVTAARYVSALRVTARSPGRARLLATTRCPRVVRVVTASASMEYVTPKFHSMTPVNAASWHVGIVNVTCHSASTARPAPTGFSTTSPGCGPQSTSRTTPRLTASFPNPRPSYRSSSPDLVRRAIISRTSAVVPPLFAIVYLSPIENSHAVTVRRAASYRGDTRYKVVSVVSLNM
ncbi:hypothetical protein J8F10_15945 [Gemmata sp. G18]|uniref:Uncharacterized protein n=1 Tax=Gemmata palustris TaxID=2822762 RepID=A0ABS5BTZ5_9BACT|nr:hypothetical protein [Gemmata palustris]MBP3956765.1 hypothetical protein [Gemmata palustris]